MPEQINTTSSNIKPGDTTNPNIPQDAFSVDQIQVIPSKFYGAATKIKIKSSSPSSPSPKSSKTSIVLYLILFILLILVGVGGYYIYLNKDKYFPAQAPVKEQSEPLVKKETPKITIPKTPTGLRATSTNPNNVNLSWSDQSDNEAAFRIERRTQDSKIYKRISDLPPNSSVFQDHSVQASTTYYYRVVARNSAGESPVSSDIEITTQPKPQVKPVAKLPPAGLDTDSDGITDLEEEIFKSNGRNPDTDGDGFLDGNEVFNLYNPNGRAPAKLIESGTVKKISGEIGWNSYIPKNWKYTEEKKGGLQGSISTDTGESFKIKIENNDKKLSVIDWLLDKTPTIKKDQLMEFKSKKGYQGIIGSDLLTTYIPWEDKIFVFRYDLQKKPFINYRTIYSMMLNFLELNGLKLQVIQAGSGELPFEPGVSIPGQITAPKVINSTTTEIKNETRETTTTSSSVTNTSSKSATTSTQ